MAKGITVTEHILVCRVGMAHQYSSNAPGFLVGLRLVEPTSRRAMPTLPEMGVWVIIPMTNDYEKRSGKWPKG